MEWKEVCKEAPSRNEEIIFMTGDEQVHIGEIFSPEKLKKCIFRSFTSKDDYGCDSKTPLEDRVIYWSPIPRKPKNKG